VRNFLLDLFFSFHFNLSGYLFFFVINFIDHVNLFFSGLFQISGKIFPGTCGFWGFGDGYMVYLLVTLKYCHLISVRPGKTDVMLSRATFFLANQMLS